MMTKQYFIFFCLFILFVNFGESQVPKLSLVQKKDLGYQTDLKSITLVSIFYSVILSFLWWSVVRRYPCITPALYCFNRKDIVEVLDRVIIGFSSESKLHNHLSTLIFWCDGRIYILSMSRRFCLVLMRLQYDIHTIKYPVDDHFVPTMQKNECCKF